MYKIKTYTVLKAAFLKVTVKASLVKNKKLDVFRNKIYICSIGDTRYSDYPTYLQTHGLAYATNRRKLYKNRHENDRHIFNTPGYYADQLLW